MKRILFPVILVAVLVWGVSCMDDVKKELTPHAAITSFVVGYYNVEYHDLNAQGNDTVLYYREGGSKYPMTIDQTNNLIYNIDSLPYGADVRKVLTLVYSEGSVYYHYGDNPDSVIAWSSYDSIDFTRPLVYTAVSSDATYKRDYTVKLNVRKVFPDSLLWSQSDSTGFTALKEPCAFVLYDKFFNFGKDTSGGLLMTSNSIFVGVWSSPTALKGLGSDGWSRNVIAFKDTMYLQSGTKVYGSSDGISWTEVKSDIKCLVRTDAGSNAVWAVTTDSSIIKTTDMVEWTVYGKKPVGFPDSTAVSLDYALATNSSISKTILVGMADDSLYASGWTILSTDSVWSRIDAPEDVNWRLPLMKETSILKYDGKLYAFGTGFQGFRQSNDNGITWYMCDTRADENSTYNRYMQLPKTLKGFEGSFSCSVDRFGTIWILTDDGQVWRGAITRLDKRNR
jgi:hypothetical protein